MPEQQEESVIKNSVLREMTDKPFKKFASHLHNNYPRLTANHVTLLTAAASIMTTEFLIRNNEDILSRAVGSIAYVGSRSGDRLDGALAEERKETTLFGNLLDALMDKTVESADCFRVALRSLENGDRIGATLNFLAGMTSPLPALFRADAEANNTIVKEGGMGTRPVRSGLIFLNVLFGKNKHVSRVLGGTILAMNLSTTISRINAKNNSDAKHYVGILNNEKAQNEAKVRRKALSIFSAVAIVFGSVGIFKTLENTDT